MLRYLLMLVIVLVVGCTRSENSGLEQDCNVLKALKCGMSQQQNTAQESQSDIEKICSTLNVDITCSEVQPHGNEVRSHDIVVSTCPGAAVIMGVGDFSSGNYKFSEQQKAQLSQKMNHFVNSSTVKRITTYGHTDPQSISQGAWERDMRVSCSDISRSDTAELGCSNLSDGEPSQACKAYCLGQLRAQSAGEKIKAIIGAPIQQKVIVSADFSEDFRDFSLRVSPETKKCIDGIHTKLKTRIRYDQACDKLDLSANCNWDDLRRKLSSTSILKEHKSSALKSLSVFRNMVIEIQYEDATHHPNVFKISQ